MGILVRFDGKFFQRSRSGLATILSALALSTAISSASHSQSFDCRTDRRIDERAICSDPVLSHLDVLYTRNYNVARALSGSRTTDLARSFNRARAECGANRECIRAIQIKGIEALQQLGGPFSVPSELRLGFGTAAGTAPPIAAVSQTNVIVMQSSAIPRHEISGQSAERNTVPNASTSFVAAEAQREMGTVRSTAETSSLDEDSLTTMSARFDQAVRDRSLYRTPVRPDDRDLGVTARAASEAFPKVPYYIPGTRESGRFWIAPRVSDTGVLMYDLTFVDPGASVDPRRAVIDLTAAQLERMTVAVAKLSEWSEVAHRNELRKSYRKRVDCFPRTACPGDGDKAEGQTSTEVIFIVSEDGSTAGRIQRNKGRFEEGYNVSIKSARLLTSYLRYVQSRGEREFAAGTRTAADLDNMFK